jgi:hypothetical protein
MPCGVNRPSYMSEDAAGGGIEMYQGVGSGPQQRTCLWGAEQDPAGLP